VIVADEDEIDVRKAFQDHTGICHRLDAGQSRADGVNQNRIGNDVQGGSLDEGRGVSDPKHADSMQQRFGGNSIGFCLEARGPILFLGSQLPCDLDLIPDRVVSHGGAVVKSAPIEMIRSWPFRGAASLDEQPGDQAYRHADTNDAQVVLATATLTVDAAIARMSRFSKITPWRSPVPRTATSTIARAKSSARITWLGSNTRNAGSIQRIRR